MSGNKNGKNGSEKEIDRLMRLVETLGRIDAKVATLCDQLHEINGRLTTVETEGTVVMQEKVKTIEVETIALKRDNDALLKKYNDLTIAFEKIKASYEKTKWIWAAIAFVVVPIVTAILSYLVIHL